MQAVQVSVKASVAARPSACGARPALPVRGVACQAKTGDASAEKARNLGIASGLASMASMLAYSGQAAAANELAMLADGDNRLGLIATLFVPMLGWVAFNALGPGLNQLEDMTEKAKSRKGAFMAGAAGLGGLLAAQGADAAEIAQLADGDNRFGLIAALFIPVLGWVAFNALGPGLNQLEDMTEKAKSRKGAFMAGAAGLGGLLAAQGADAAEIAQLADGDNRFGLIAALFIPVLGWVAFNALGPGLNQLEDMTEKAKSRK